MRTRTFVISLVVHALMIGAAIVSPILATDALPEPPRTSAFVLVRAQPLPEMRRAAAPRAATAAAASTSSPPPTPVIEPTAVQAEEPGDPGGSLSDTPGGVIGFDAGVTAVTIDPPPPAPRQSTPPVRVGGTIRAPRKIHHVAPVYPAIAQSARITGVVILEAIIAEDGTVGMVTLLRSVRFLDDAAVEAVRQWRFTPTLLNGQPVPVIMTVTVSFGLN